MIVFSYSPHGITIIRTFSKPSNGDLYRTTRKPQDIGRFNFVRGVKDSLMCWLWDAGRASLDIYRTLSHSEKRDIIGMLDALNQAPIRPITDMKRRWEEIIGLEAVEYLRTDNEAKPLRYRTQ